jgi:hypothetical protein
MDETLNIHAECGDQPHPQDSKPNRLSDLREGSMPRAHATSFLGPVPPGLPPLPSPLVFQEECRMQRLISLPLLLHVRQRNL